MSDTSTQHVIYPEDKLPFTKNIIASVQHIIAMFGATVLGPLLMGFDPNVAILFSGVATLIFYFCVSGKIPSYLGSSFSFIAAVIAVTGYTGTGANSHLDIALGGILAAGLLYAGVGYLVTRIGHVWIESLLPPVLTGVIVAVIGLNLAPVAVHQINGSLSDIAFGLMTITFVALAAVYLPRFWARLPILIGGAAASLLYCVAGNVLGLVKPIGFADFIGADWLGVPHFSYPAFDITAITMIAPVAIILMAENLGHVRAIAAMTERNLDDSLGRAFMGDGLATIVSSFFGGTGVTTYAENMGVMAITKNFSSRTFVFAGVIAILLGFSPKFGALIHLIPSPVIGGLSFVVFGLITATAGRIWVDGKINFSDPKNLITVGVTAVIGAGDLSIKIGSFSLGGIAVATFTAIGLYHGLAYVEKHKKQ